MQGLFSLKFRNTVGVNRVWPIRGTEGCPKNRCLAIHLDGRDEDETPDSCRSRLLRQGQRAIDVRRAISGKWVSGATLHHMRARGAVDDIRACIGCNQACIGHFHRGLPVSCIQHPQTGRELTYGSLIPALVPKRVMVVGGGPAGMKAAATAAQRGHHVTLYEAGQHLGGQALKAQLLPGRAEFGGIVTNLTREMELAQVQIRRGTRVTVDLVEAERPDVVILATGALPYVPDLPTDGQVQIVTAWQVLEGKATPGARVLVADWRCDWIGPGIAERLTRAGSHVTLAVNGTHPGESLPLYVRDTMAATLQDLGVAIRPYARLYGTAGDTVYLQHTASGAAMEVTGVDTVVLALGHQSVDDLSASLLAKGMDVRMIGDCLSPRTAEEAVFDGLKAGVAV